MDIEQFWNLIDNSRERAGGDPEEHAKELEKDLRELPADQIESFQTHFDALMDRAYSWDLWGAAYLIGGGCSDDGFMDFRGWLISRGRDIYEAALVNPDSLAYLVADGGENCECEVFLYAASKAWGKKTGRDSFDMPRSGSRVSKPTGEPWDEDEDLLMERYPQIAAKLE